MIQIIFLNNENNKLNNHNKLIKITTNFTLPHTPPGLKKWRPDILFHFKVWDGCDVNMSRIAFPASERKFSNKGELAAKDVRQLILSFQSCVNGIADFDISNSSDLYRIGSLRSLVDRRNGTIVSWSFTSAWVVSCSSSVSSWFVSRCVALLLSRIEISSSALTVSVEGWASPCTSIGPCWVSWVSVWTSGSPIIFELLSYKKKHF